MVCKISGFHKGDGELVASQCQDVRHLIAPTVRWIAAQHRAVLRQALGRDGAEIMAKIEAATMDLEATVARSVEGGLQEIISDEVRSLFEDALKCADGSATEANVIGVQALSGQEFGDTKAGPSADAEGVMPRNSSPSVKDNDTSEESSGRHDDELYEGNVTLILEAGSGVGQVLQFLRELRREPEVRLVRLASKLQTGVGIRLALRQPLHLKTMLPKIKGVSQVSPTLERSPEEQERMITVQLKDIPHPATGRSA